MKDRKENCRDFNNVDIGRNKQSSFVMKRWNKREKKVKRSRSKEAIESEQNEKL